MKQRVRICIFNSLAIGCLTTSPPIWAQIVPDTTMPVNSIVTPQGNTITITGGTSAGANLFHSFREFSLPTGTTAHFNNNIEIQNIITRVTGGAISNIDGTIKANGTANLFLLNPNGIIFGPNASLNIGGSFMGTTASSIKFAGGTEFSARNPTAPPLLTVNVPVGLQFGQNPGEIVVRGAGNNLSLNLDTREIIRDNRSVGLQVSAGQTLALVGGDISLVGGNVTAEGGRIEMGSVGAGSYVSLIPNSAGWVLDYSGVENFQDIQLSQAASADVSGSGSGTIQVTGRRVNLSEGSAIIGLTEGGNAGGTLSVRAAESVEVTGTTPDGVFASGLFADVSPGATGSGGDLTVETGRLSLRDGAQISASTYGAGDAGTLTVRATESVELIGSYLFAEVNSGATGNGGDLTVETGRLTLRDGAQISTTTFGAGDAGTLTVRATESVELIGSYLFAEVNSGATGNGGDLTVETGRLTLRDGAQINASTYGAGDAGTLTVRATESAELIGTSSSGSAVSGLFASADSDSTGNGGDLTVETGRLTLRDGAQIGTTTFGAGDAGTLTVRATEAAELIGTSSSGSAVSGLFASADSDSTGNGGNLTVETGRLTLRDGAQIAADTYGAGRGGNLTVETGRLTLRDGAVISASTLGAGDAGTLTVRATESVELIGSYLFSDVNSGATGNGGNLIVETGRLTLRDGAQIDASTFGAGDAGTLTVRATESVELIGSYLFAEVNSGATGNGGNLTVETGRLTLRDGAVIAASTFGAGNAGKLTVRAAESVEVIGSTPDGLILSGLFASAEENSTGNGGDLTVETGRLILRDWARIDASTFGAGDAGTLTVRATESVDLIGTSTDGQFFSGLFASTEPDSTGNGGDLTVETGRLTIRDRAQIFVGTWGAGDAGTLTVLATESVELIDGDLFASVSPGATGNGSNLTVETRRLTVRNGGAIGAGTFGAGDAGTLIVRASESVDLIGTSADGVYHSGLFVSTEPNSTGKGGDLIVETGRLTVRDRATVNASSLGTGVAGNLEITASAIRLDNQASVAADTSGGGGNITLNADTIQLRHNSRITTNATGTSSGGNITFNTDTIAALENSDISANSQESFGGKVTINAQGIFGTEYRLVPTTNSDITATGGSPELNGTVTINTPDTDPTSGLIELPSQLQDITGLIRNPCEAVARGSSFTFTGRGGIPQSPTDPLTGTALAVDWISPPKETSPPPKHTQEIPKSPNPGSHPQLVEAQGWVISPTGEITLTANPPSPTPHSFWQPPANCPQIR